MPKPMFENTSQGDSQFVAILNLINQALGDLDNVNTVEDLNAIKAKLLAVIPKIEAIQNEIIPISAFLNVATTII